MRKRGGCRRVVRVSEQPDGQFRPERVACRRDLPAVPAGPQLGRQGLVGLLRRLPARRVRTAAASPTRVRTRRAARREPAGAAAAAAGRRRLSPRPGRRRRRADRPTAKPKPAPPVPGGAEAHAAQGAAARVVTNMEASLDGPDRDQRARRPGQAADRQPHRHQQPPRRAAAAARSRFTHLIGYAMVQALKAMPEMNNGFAEVDGKPALVKPEHVNLGLAIDLAKPDGTRQLLVPSHQGRRDDGLRASSGRPTRTSSAGPAATSSPSTTSPAPRSA